MKTTMLGWRPSVIGFGQTEDEGGEYVDGVYFPDDYDPFKGLSDSNTGGSVFQGTKASGTDWGEKLLGAIIDIGTPAATTFIRQQVSGPAGAPGSLITAPGGAQFMWNAAGQLVPVNPVSSSAAQKAAALLGKGTPAWLIPAAIGAAALILLVAMKKK